MTNALIGFTGFVGSTLLQQARFEALYRSTNIGEIENKAFDIVVCAGAQAQKWIANREPEGDLQNIHRLMARLRTVRCRKFILISTADVLKARLRWMKPLWSMRRACMPMVCTGVCLSNM